MDRPRGEQREPGEHTDDERDERRQLAPAAQPASKWKSWLVIVRMPVIAVALIGGAVLAARHVMKEPPEPSCRQIWDQDLGYDRAVVTCQREYDRTKDPRIGTILANSLSRVGSDEAAEKVARGLLETKARPDALLLLAKLAFGAGKNDQAREMFEQAEQIYTGAGDWAQAAKTVLAWARMSNDEQKYLEALEQMERCVHLARQAGAKSIEANCHAGAARIFISLGAGELAWSELSKAREIDAATVERDAIGLAADYLQESSGEDRQATAHFEEALAQIQKVKSRELAAGVHLNLAYSFARIGKLDDAADQLQRAKIASSEKSLPGNTFSVEGYLEMKKKNFAAADALLARAIDVFTSKPQQEEWDDVAVAANDRAAMALASGDLAAAVAHARQATWALERLLFAQKLPLYRSWITARHRYSYELLFVALARHGEPVQALAAVDRWMSHGAIDALMPRSPPALELDEAIAATKAMASTHASLQKSELASSLTTMDLLQRISGEDLIIMVIAEGELWRVASHAGTLSIESVGDYAVLSRELFDGFKSDPFDEKRAAAVGNLFLPAEMANARQQPLYLVLDERLTTLPVEAMRVAGQLVLERRPIVRALRPSLLGCESPLPASPKATVLADSVGDLPGGLRAAKAVAAKFGARAWSGPEATRARLQAPAELLHLALHGNVDASGAGVLTFADGNENGVDIAMRGSAPALVFLAACKSALAEHGSYSLATAFLSAGSHQVIAALNFVNDELAADVTTSFYDHGGARDPAAALAKTLSAVAAAHERDATVEWPRFAVFGHATCKTVTPLR